MVALLMPIHRFILLLTLIQSASLYKIYALNSDPSNSMSQSLSSSIHKEPNHVLPIHNVEYYDQDDNDDEADIGFDVKNEGINSALASWLTSMSEINEHEKPLLKRSLFPLKFGSTKGLVQRRNYRPHWNPLVAAYKRCGELPVLEERESCFKEAVQRLFVFKLRK